MNTEQARERAFGLLDEAGLSGSLLVRDLDSGTEVGIDEDALLPIASLVKLPLAAAVLTAAEDGRVDLAGEVEILPGEKTPGPTGVSRFTGRAVMSVDDLLYLAMAISDNAAADALFRMVPPEEVSGWLAAAGVPSIHVRHRISDIYHSIANRVEANDQELLHRLVVAADRAGEPSPIPQLDPRHANAGSARGFVTLLSLIWSDDPRMPAASRRRLRELLGANLIRQRLAPDFVSDRSRWFSKTGTFLTLRHEVGVVEHADGRRIAVAALTRSRIAAEAQPAAEAVLGRAARILHDHVIAAS